MPWEKNFVLEDVVERAMEVFWEKGYEATSIADLIDATGVQRQSLYNAFGDKRGLFVRTLEKFEFEHQTRVLEALEAKGKPLSSINKILRDAADDVNSRGCFMVNTTLELRIHDEEIKALLSNAAGDFRIWFIKIIEQGKSQGEIPATVNANEVASGLLAALYGIRVMGRGTVGNNERHQAVDQALLLLT